MVRNVIRTQNLGNFFDGEVMQIGKREKYDLGRLETEKVQKVILMRCPGFKTS